MMCKRVTIGVSVVRSSSVAGRVKRIGSARFDTGVGPVMVVRRQCVGLGLVPLRVLAVLVQERAGTVAVVVADAVAVVVVDFGWGCWVAVWLLGGGR